MKKKLDSLQALRALAFLGIFTSHAQLNSQFGAWGVSVFFVLSGFLMVYAYWDREVPKSLKACVQFGVGKVSKLYPLHIFTLILAIPFEVERSMGNGTASFWYFAKKIFGSLTLLQSWDTDFWIYGAFNGVAWFLSACLLLYFCFPWILRLLKKIKSGLGWGVLLIAAYGVQAVFLYLTRNTAFSTYPDTNYWIAYTFPPLRLLDFFAGCVLGCLFMHRKRELHWAPASLLEIVTFVLIFLSALVYVNPGIFLGRNWFRYTGLWLPTSCMIVYLFACKRGFVTRLLSNKVLVWLGDLSPYGFLFHWMAMVYTQNITNWVYTRYPGLMYENLFSQISLSIPWAVVYKLQYTVISLGLTIACSMLWMRYEKHRSKRL